MIDDKNNNNEEEQKNQVLDLLELEEKSKVKDLFAKIHPANQCDLISAISKDQREKLLLIIGSNIDASLLSYLENDLKNEIIYFIGAKNSAKAISKLDVDDAVEIIEDIKSEEDIDHILRHFTPSKRIKIEEALSYDEDTIGRVMRDDYIAINKDSTVGQATTYLQKRNNLPDNFQYIIITDNNNKPISEIPVSKIVVNHKNTLISSLISEESEIKKINVNADQETAARFFNKYSLTYASVVDDNEKLVGAISIEDIAEILDEEDQEDLLLLGGVNDSNLYSSSFLTAKSRAPWLFTSLITTSLAAAIIALFSDEIEKAVVLAVLLPIIASLSGNAGTQALTVLVRSIATNEINNIGSFKILIKEVCVGSFNGLFLALVASIICYLWKANFVLSVVLGTTIFLTIILAGFFGATIPILLNKMKFDPAISSGVFLITFTDAFSFLIFLGLASIFIL